MGYTDVIIGEKVREIKKYSFDKNDWLRDKSDEYIIIDHVKI